MSGGKGMKYYPEVKALCRFFNISRAAYDEWVKRANKPDKDTERVELVREAYEKSRKTYGYRRITLGIQQNKGIAINHKAILRLMNNMKGYN